MSITKTATTAWSETRLWATLLARLGSRWPGHVVVALALGWLACLNLPWVLVVVVATAVVCRAAAVRWPQAWWVLVGPVVGTWQAHQLRQVWPDVVERCGLGEATRLGVARHWPLVVRAKLLPGRTLVDFEEAADAIRTAAGASQIRVEPDGVRHVRLAFTFVDVLARPFAARVPSGGIGRHVVVGRRWDGADWRLPLGPHTLVAGCSGAGKGSVLWSFVFSLASGVRSGEVQLHGIDLKGGMEILMGRSFFTTVATTPAEAVASLELLVGWMQERTSAYAGRVRDHRPTSDEPLHVIVIDELAALTAYASDRELQRRGEIALNLLLSQGRAAGFVVLACLQDPRKEVVPARGLFTQMIGLRLKDGSESTMVLGEAAVAAGANCHRLPRDLPGTGYVVPEDGGAPVKVRAGFASDEDIKSTAKCYATQTTLCALPARTELPGRSRRSDRARASSA